MNQGGDGFKDHFSSLAGGYSRFRPGYPPELFAYLGSIAPATDLAWDCATGSGQAALALAPYFTSVIATDASQQQIAQARQHPALEYRVATAESSGLESGSVDLISVAQALHWFDLPGFMAEAQRVLKVRGVLAVWTYNLFRVTPMVDAVVDDLYWHTLKGYWPRERSMVEDGYAGIVMPLAKLEPPQFHMSAHWDLEHLLGYLRTWSAVRRYREEKGVDPIAAFAARLKQAWGEEELKREVSWPLTLRVGVNQS